MASLNGHRLCSSCRETYPYWIKHQCPIEVRLIGACIAISRFLAFVWMEAFARDLCSSIPWKAERAIALAEAIEFGMLRLDWGRP